MGESILMTAEGVSTVQGIEEGGGGYPD